MYYKDPTTIQSMFNSIARRYDRNNAILSFSLHKRWNRTLVQHVLNRASSPHVLMDLCSGTGDIAFEYLRTTSSPCHAYLIDFSAEMLAYAKLKEAQLSFGSDHQLAYIEANVQSIPLPDGHADCATMAYGIRNVQNPSLCIRDVYRVLKPGGSFGILELTRPTSPLLRMGHQLYLHTVLPLLGKWLSDNQQAYHYLCQSIETFIEPKKIEDLFNQHGFIHTDCLPLTGGIATLIIGNKPA